MAVAAFLFLGILNGYSFFDLTPEEKNEKESNKNVELLKKNIFQEDANGLDANRIKIKKLISIAPNTNIVGSGGMAIFRYPSEMDIFEIRSYPTESRQEAANLAVEDLKFIAHKLAAKTSLTYAEFHVGFDERIYTDIGTATMGGMGQAVFSSFIPKNFLKHIRNLQKLGLLSSEAFSRLRHLTEQVDRAKKAVDKIGYFRELYIEFKKNWIIKWTLNEIVAEEKRITLINGKRKRGLKIITKVEKLIDSVQENAVVKVVVWAKDQGLSIIECSNAFFFRYGILNTWLGPSLYTYLDDLTSEIYFYRNLDPLKTFKREFQRARILDLIYPARSRTLILRMQKMEFDIWYKIFNGALGWLGRFSSDCELISFLLNSELDIADSIIIEKISGLKEKVEKVLEELKDKSKSGKVSYFDTKIIVSTLEKVSSQLGLISTNEGLDRTQTARIILTVKEEIKHLTLSGTKTLLFIERAFMRDYFSR